MATDLTLRQFLLLVLGQGTILGPFVFLIFEKLSLGQNLAPSWKRVLVGVVSGLLGISLWAVALSLGYVELGDTRDALAQALWQYGVLTGFVAFTSANIIHGFLKMPGLQPLTAELQVGEALVQPPTLDEIRAAFAAELTDKPFVCPVVAKEDQQEKGSTEESTETVTSDADTGEHDGPSVDVSSLAAAEAPQMDASSVDASRAKLTSLLQQLSEEINRPTSDKPEDTAQEVQG